MTTCVQRPYGFAQLLSSAQNFQKLFMPGTFNSSQVLNSIYKQEVERAIIDPDLFNVELPPASAAKYVDMCSGVKEVLVVADPSQVGQTQIFKNAKVTIVDQDAI